MAKIVPNKRLFIELPQGVPDLTGLNLYYAPEGVVIDQSVPTEGQQVLKIEPLPDAVTAEISGATRTGVYVDLPPIPADTNMQFRAAYYDDVGNEPDLSPAAIVQIDREPPPKIENVYVVDAPSESANASGSTS